MLKRKKNYKNHVTYYFFELLAPKRSKKMHKKINFSKVAKFEGKIRIDLIMIFYINIFFCEPKYFGSFFLQKLYSSQKMQNVLIGVFVYLNFFVRFLVFELWSIWYFSG